VDTWTRAVGALLPRTKWTLALDRTKWTLALDRTKWTLALDRTEWKRGDTTINLLVLD
jgi:hypothetical protein